MEQKQQNPGTKATVRRLSRRTFVAEELEWPGQRIGNKSMINRRQSMFKIKTLLPQIKQVEDFFNSVSRNENKMKNESLECKLKQ